MTMNTDNRLTGRAGGADARAARSPGHAAPCSTSTPSACRPTWKKASAPSAAWPTRWTMPNRHERQREPEKLGLPSQATMEHESWCPGRRRGFPPGHHHGHELIMGDDLDAARYRYRRGQKVSPVPLCRCTSLCQAW